VPDARAYPSGHGEEKRHGEELPQRSHQRVDEPGLGAEYEECVCRAVGLAARVGRRQRVAGVDRRAWEVQHGQRHADRPHQRAVDPRGQTARREGQDQIDELKLDDPARDAADAVEDGAVRLGESRQEPANPGRDEHRTEALVRPALPRVAADRDRDGDHQRSYRCDERSATGVVTQRGHHHRRAREHDPQRGRCSDPCHASRREPTPPQEGGVHPCGRRTALAASEA
jgi:hypothetical protein